MSNPDTSKMKGFHVLVVDDNPGSLKLLTDILSEKGYHVRPTSSGKLALRSAEAQPPDLILLDIIMPEIDGYEVCHKLKQNDVTKDIPVIFISSLEDATDKVRGFEAGGVDFVSKPYQKEEVLARVHTHLSLRNLQIQLKEQNDILQDEILVRERTEEELLLYQNNLEAMVKERTDELNMFFSLNLDLLCIANGVGYFIRLNPKWEETLGYTLNELLEQPYLTFVHPDDQAEASRIAQITSDSAIMNYVNRYMHKDGSFRWLEWYSCPFEGRIYAAARDITDRVSLEEERKKLIHQIQGNIAELAILNDGIRNPLSIILSRAEQLENDDGDIIMDEVSRIDDIVTNLDKRWIDSVKIFSYLEKHHQMTF
jgi:PAS domain S-box-containing protein